MPNVAGRLLQLLMCMDCNCGNARLGESVIALAGMPAWRLISDGGVALSTWRLLGDEGGGALSFALFMNALGTQL